jgi:hypothetical protein
LLRNNYDRDTFPETYHSARPGKLTRPPLRPAARPPKQQQSNQRPQLSSKPSATTNPRRLPHARTHQPRRPTGAIRRAERAVARQRFRKPQPQHARRRHKRTPTPMRPTLATTPSPAQPSHGQPIATQPPSPANNISSPNRNLINRSPSVPPFPSQQHQQPNPQPHKPARQASPFPQPTTLAAQTAAS